jgi:hypothetical protein
LKPGEGGGCPLGSPNTCDRFRTDLVRLAERGEKGDDKIQGFGLEEGARF